MATSDHESLSSSMYTTDTFSSHPSDTFWDIGNYKNVSRRVDDTARLCDDLSKLISERAHIERRYAYKLNEWSRRWGESITKSSEYGTMKETWHASLVEATHTAEVHSKMSNKLSEYVVEDVKDWKRNKFHKGIISWKETKKIEVAFAKAQKPWAVLYGRVQRAKKAYYNTSKNYFSLCSRIDEFENTVGYSLAKVQKEKEKVLRVEGHLHRAQIKYKTRIDDLHNYKEQYVIDMTREYDSWQEMERERIAYFVHIFEQYARSLDIAQFKNLDSIYGEFERVIKRTSPVDDLTWFSQHHGKDMPRSFPYYEEYAGNSMEGIQMLDKRVVPYQMTGSDQSYFKDPATSFGGPLYPPQDIDIDINLSARLSPNPLSHQYDIPDPPDTEIGLPEQPDEADDWLLAARPKEIEETVTPECYTPADQGCDTSLFDPIPDCTNMKALYDFEAEEDDDLPFAAGDIITVFGEEKDGWVHATLDGEVGYAPFDYLEKF